MKHLFYIAIVCLTGLMSCKKTIDLYPQSNLNTGTYYTNLAEMRAGVNGCYNGLMAPMLTEWMHTELRSDNSKQGVTGSSSAPNRELNELDMFLLNPSHPKVYDYWLTSYNNIRNTNLILQKTGVAYDPAGGTLSLKEIDVPISETDRKQLAGEALFIRAHHYFNLVRLFGGVFLVYEPITPAQAKTMNRVSADEIYKLIRADLTTASQWMSQLRYNQMVAADLGKATTWAAKTLLAKVELTLNRKAEAIALLNDVRTNSGHALQASYANVFGIATEVNSEIIFTIRYKAGGVGLGSPFANVFAPLQSGSAVVNGDGNGLNYPTAEIDSTVKTNDGRRATVIARYVSGATIKPYTRKYLSAVAVAGDAENDWPILRFADVLLMLAEAQGYTQASLDVINLVRARATLPPLTMATVTSVAQFEQALSNERRIEFAFENHRWFDLLRYNTTLTTITAENTIKAHYAFEYPVHYKDYPAPALTLAELQAKVTKEKLLLPIPQREIDTNTQLAIPQNPGY